MFYTSIINEFNEKIARLDNTTETQLKKANEGIRIASWALDAFRVHVINTGFETLQDEVSFFKSIKCQPMKYLIYFTEIRSCELRIPKSDTDSQKAFLAKQNSKVNQFFERHTEFLLYMEQGYTHFDQHYFTRENLNNNPVVKSYPYYKDSNFNTSHDEIWARIKGLAMYANYLKMKRKRLDTRILHSDFQNLKWTGSYAALVEMLYGCQEMGYFNNGNVEIGKVIAAFCEFLSMKSGNSSRTYQELKNRKGNRIKFFDETGKRLLERMDDEDGIN